MTAAMLPSLTARLICLAHPDGGRVVAQINHWVANSGVEWTVKRLKAYRTAALQLRAGNHSVVRSIYQEESIGYTKNDLLPRGPFRSVFREFLQAQRPIVLRRLDVILRAYTAFKLSVLSDSQLTKALEAITGGYRGRPEAIVLAQSLVRLGAVTLGLPDSPAVKRPSVCRLKPGTSTHSEGRLPKDLRKLPYGKLAWSLCTSCAASEDLMNDYPQADAFRRLCIDGGADETTSGHIAFLQEKGCKARVVAVPNAWNQWLFEPLHQLLDDLARDLQCSAVHDQNTGAWFIQEYLGENRLYCFDLSSATDRFPLAVQTQLLRSLNLQRYADALEQTCQAWRVTVAPFYGRKVDYAVGQPMGLYGSFPLFHLTHCCLLAGIVAKLGVNPLTSRSFLVLGDDVLIRHPKVATLYRGLLDALGVDISNAKSISSSSVAEFAGFIGVKTSNGVAAYRPFKHDNREIVNNPVGLLNSLGHRLSRYAKWRKWVRAFERTRGWRLPDLSPLLPDEQDYGVNPMTISPERFASLLHQSELVALDQDCLDYVNPDFDWSEDWRPVVEELFNKQSPKREFGSLSEFLAQIERHADLEDSVVEIERSKFTQPPKSLNRDPVLKQFIQEDPPRPEPAMAKDTGITGPDAVEALRACCEAEGFLKSSSFTGQGSKP